MAPDPHNPLAGRRLFGVTCCVEALLLVGLLILLSQALQPNFGGGRFVVVTLLAGLVLLGIALTRDVIAAVIADRRSALRRAEADAGSREWGVVARGLALIVVLFSLIVIFGTPVGMTVVALIILRWHIRATLGPTIGGAVILGVLIPVAFGWAVGITLWPGLVPELIPGWLGGGILPPL